MKCSENPKWLSIDWPNYVNDEEEGENSDDIEEDENDSVNSDSEENNYDEIKETFSSNDKNDREKSYLKKENTLIGDFKDLTNNDGKIVSNQNKKPEYLFRSEYVSNRLSDDEVQSAKKIASKWKEFNKKSINSCGNIANEIVYCDKSKTLKFVPMTDIFQFLMETKLIFCQCTPSERVLYRLLCLFDIKNISDTDRYQMVWNIQLQNKNTKEVICFYDLKGAFSFGSTVQTYSQLKCKDELIELLELLIIKKCPHTYDNVNAGSVA